VDGGGNDDDCGAKHVCKRWREERYLTQNFDFEKIPSERRNGGKRYLMNKLSVVLPASGGRPHPQPQLVLSSSTSTMNHGIRFER